MSARDDYPNMQWHVEIGRPKNGPLIQQIAAALAEIDRLRTDRSDLVKVARVGGGPERYIRFTPDYGSERARKLAAEVFGVDLDTPWHECHPDLPGSNDCPGCEALSRVGGDE